MTVIQIVLLVGVVIFIGGYFLQINSIPGIYYYEDDDRLIQECIRLDEEMDLAEEDFLRPVLLLLLFFLAMLFLV